MRCKVLAFGISKEIVGQRELNLDYNPGLTAGLLKQQLIEQFPRLGALRSMFIAVNGVYAHDEAEIRPGDEIAMIPPVSGG
jgi:molybdopterin synthase sulfur carrier subunit